MKYIAILLLFLNQNLTLAQNSKDHLQGKWSLEITVEKNDTLFYLNHPEYNNIDIQGLDDYSPELISDAKKEAYETSKSIRLIFKDSYYYGTTRYTSKDMTTKKQYDIKDKKLLLWLSDTKSKTFTFYFSEGYRELTLIEENGKLSKWRKGKE